MDELFPSVVQKVLWPPITLAAVFTFILKYIVDDKKSRSQISQALREWKVWGAYKRMLTSVLSAADTFFGNDRYFSWLSWRRCFQIAVVYPLLLLTLGWLFGGPSEFAGTFLLPSGFSSWQRLAFTVFLFAWGVLYGSFLRPVTWQQASFIHQRDQVLASWPKHPAIRVAATLFVFAIAGGVAGLAVALTAMGEPMSLAFALAVAFAFAGGMTFSKASGSVLYWALATAAAIIAQIVMAGAPFLHSMLLVTVVFAIAAIPIVVAGARPNSTFLASAVVQTFPFTIANIGAVAIAYTATNMAYTAFPAHGGLLVVWLLFFLLLPALNSVFDFLSWGASRYLLHDVAHEDRSISRTASHIVIEFALGLLLLYSLAFFIPFIIQLFNLFAARWGRPSIEWSAYAREALHAPWTSGLMVTVMLLSTLIPTAGHFFLATVSLVIRVAPYREWVAMLLNDPEPSNLHKTIAASWLTGYIVFAFAVLLGTTVLLWHCFNAFAFDIGLSLYEVAKFSSSLLTPP
jgi:hypothetical protein